ncbi:hypothetical protein HDU99_010174, partial [Rhizoclosmatium hyalinum]
MQPNCHIQSVTAEEAHAEFATSRIQYRGFSGKVDVFHGDALNLDSWRRMVLLNAAEGEPEKVALWEDGTVDSIISLDACYHFNTRREFLALCAKKLKQGTGLLSLSDIVLGAGGEEDQLSAMDRFYLHMFCSMSGVPLVNLVSLSEYKASIEGAGFHELEVEDISKDVFPGLERFLTAQGDKMGPFLNGTRWMQYGTGMKLFLSWIIQKR